MKERCVHHHKEVIFDLDTHYICDYIWESFIAFHSRKIYLEQSIFPSHQYQKENWKINEHFSKEIVLQKPIIVVRSKFSIVLAVRGSALLMSP